MPLLFNKLFRFDKRDTCMHNRLISKPSIRALLWHDPVQMSNPVTHSRSQSVRNLCLLVANLTRDQQLVGSWVNKWHKNRREMKKQLRNLLNEKVYMDININMICRFSLYLGCA